MEKPWSLPLPLIALFSGGGRTVLNLQDAIDAGRLNARLITCISSSPQSPGIDRLRARGLDVQVVARREFNDTAAFSLAIWSQAESRMAGWLDANPVDAQSLPPGCVDLPGRFTVVLAGFLSLLTIPPTYEHRVINIHPSLLPRFGGKGMFGHHVHEAVVAAGEAVSGCTVHFADSTYDTGPTLLQRLCVLAADDGPDDVAARVFEQECEAYPAALQRLAEGRVIPASPVCRTLPPIADFLERAEAFCFLAHEGQRRDGETDQPYASHPAAVVQILQRVGVRDPQVLAAAWLHDTVEDTAVTTEQLARAFSPRVAGVVSELTIPAECRKLAAVKHRYLAEHARKLSPDAKLIKLADRLHNLTDLVHRPADQARTYAAATRDLLEGLKPWPQPSLGEACIRLAARYEA